MTRLQELMKYTIEELIYSGNIKDIQMVINELITTLCDVSLNEGYSQGYDECIIEEEENDTL